MLIILYELPLTYHTETAGSLGLVAGEDVTVAGANSCHVLAVPCCCTCVLFVKMVPEDMRVSVAMTTQCLHTVCVVIIVILWPPRRFT